MILKRAIFYAAGVAALSAATAVCVISLAYALHAALAPHIGVAWASAAVALAAALLIGGLAFGLLARARGPKVKPGEDRDLTSRLIDLARDKPLIAAGAAVAAAAAAAVAMRSPRLAAAVLSAILAGRATKK